MFLYPLNSNYRENMNNEKELAMDEAAVKDDRQPLNEKTYSGSGVFV